MAAMVLGQRTDCEAKSEVVAGQPHMRLNAARIKMMRCDGVGVRFGYKRERTMTRCEWLCSED